jgi:HPt (histidine-containing phosphotransfer) domain-containing protein
MDEYLSKPVRRQELHRALSNFCRPQTSAEDAGPTVTQETKPVPAEESQPASDSGKAETDAVIPVIDWKEAMANVADDKDLFIAVKDSAMEEIPSLLPQLTEAIDQGNAPESQRFAHTIKGAARVIAATKTMNVAQGIEQAARRGDLDAARGSLGDLQTAIDELVETLNRSEIPG